MITNSTILITGGAGFIGSTLAQSLGKENHLVVVDDLSMGKKSNLTGIKNLRFIQGDIAEHQLMEDVLQTTSFDYIFHLGAIASVADSVAEPLKTHRVNFDSTLLLLELVRTYQKNLKRFVFSSSAAVYGDESTLPKNETTSIIRPLTPYAIDKFSSERYVLDYHDLYHVPTAAVRFFNVYGPNQNPESPYSGVISILLDCYKQNLAGQTKTFKLFGDGLQTRDFVYVADVIQALLLVATATKAKGNVYNVGTGHAISLLDIIQILNQITGLVLPIEQAAARLGDIPHSVSTIEKLTALGYQPKFTVEMGMQRYLERELYI